MSDYNLNGKGFVLVDMEDGQVETERISVDIPRKFINVQVEYDNFYKEMPKLKNEISKLDLPPIINLNVFGNDFSSSEVYDYLTRHLSDLCLSFRPTFNIEQKYEELIDFKEGPININRLIAEKFEDEGEDVVKFTINLFEELSKDKLEAAEDSIKIFYDNRYGGN